MDEELFHAIQESKIQDGLTEKEQDSLKRMFMEEPKEFKIDKKNK